MDTLRVDISYRPLRIGWVIRSGDSEAFREAVRLSHCLWGGRFNPIIVADNANEARNLVNLFRVDFLYPVGESDAVKAFPDKFPHLINPFRYDSLFVGGANDSKLARLLDIHNALVHMRDMPKGKAFLDAGMRLHDWRNDDPLSDVFLMQFGAYPEATAIGIDYRTIVSEFLKADERKLDIALPIPSDELDHPSVAYLSRQGIDRHYSTHSGWSSPGFFVGSANSLDDLTCHWNLRAADIPLFFIDPDHLARFSQVVPAWEKRMRDSVAHRPEWNRDLAVWTRREDLDACHAYFPGTKLVGCRVSKHTWNGLNVRPPMMSLGDASALGVIGREHGRPRVSFSLSDKPFCRDSWFHTQHLVASISFIGGLYEDDHHTLRLPYLPELNEFYARAVLFEYDRLRVEPERVGIVINAADTDSWLYALPVSDLIERIFRLAGFKSELSNAGLLARQLVSQLGGLQGARAFKIPGVRRLLKTHGPTAVFTKRAAIQLIGSKDPDNPGAKFDDHSDLFIGPRPEGEKLSASAVFARLVEKGLFRIGSELTCPNCRMASWTALDNLKQKVVCELCGKDYDATRQLVEGEWSYRRSGILGAEKNAQGAIPVALTLQQLQANLSDSRAEVAYSVSLNLTAMNAPGEACEIDFVWVIPRLHDNKTSIILGECKDGGPVKLDEFKRDVETLRRVADALPQERFKTFVLLSKLNPFTPDEIEQAKSLNLEHRQRAILLTARELEPYHIFERTKAEFDIRGYGSSPEALAEATTRIYFAEPDAPPGPPPTEPPNPPPDPQ